MFSCLFLRPFHRWHLWLFHFVTTIQWEFQRRTNIVKESFQKLSKLLKHRKNTIATKSAVLIRDIETLLYMTTHHHHERCFPLEGRLWISVNSHLHQLFRYLSSVPSKKPCLLLTHESAAGFTNSLSYFFTWNEEFFIDSTLDVVVQCVYDIY